MGNLHPNVSKLAALNGPGKSPTTKEGGPLVVVSPRSAYLQFTHICMFRIVYLNLAFCLKNHVKIGMFEWLDMFIDFIFRKCLPSQKYKIDTKNGHI